MLPNRRNTLIKYDHQDFIRDSNRFSSNKDSTLPRKKYDEELNIELVRKKKKGKKYKLEFMINKKISNLRPPYLNLLGNLADNSALKKMIINNSYGFNLFEYNRSNIINKFFDEIKILSLEEDESKIDINQKIDDFYKRKQKYTGIKPKIEDYVYFSSSDDISPDYFGGIIDPYRIPTVSGPDDDMITID